MTVARPLVLAVLLGLSALSSRAAAQTADAPTSSETIEKIQKALQVEPAIANSIPARFYVDVVEKKPTIADFMKGTDFSVGPMGALPPSEVRGAGGGLDVLPLIMKGVQYVRTAVRNYKIRKVRERIDKELAALDGGQ